MRTFVGKAPKRLRSLVPFIGITGGVATIGARLSPQHRAAAREWYETLDKPPFQPPAWLFGPVWSVLYASIAFSAWRVAERPPSKRRRAALLLWAAQLGLNGVWTRLFFANRRPDLALVDCLTLLALASAYAGVTHPLDRKAAALFLPYIGWLAFATVLNEEILRRNGSGAP